MSNVFSWTIGILAFLIFGCKSSDDQNSNTEQTQGHTAGKISKKEEFTFRSSYFQQTGDTDIPEVSEQTVREKFKDLSIRLSTDSIYINDLGLAIEREKIKTNSFFGRKYERDYYKSAFQLAYDEELGSEMEVIFVDFQGDQSSEFWSCFFEGGYAIVMDGNLYLNYKRYLVQYSSEPLKKASQCELPFDMWKAWKFCEYTDRTVNCDVCDSEFPLYSLKKDEKLKSSIEQSMDGRTIKNVYEMNTKKSNLHLFVVSAEPIEESTGDYFIIIQNNKNEFTSLNDENDEFLHSYFFTISSSLKVTFYENTGYIPKQKVNSEFQIQANGTYSKL